MQRVVLALTQHDPTLAADNLESTSANDSVLSSVVRSTLDDSHDGGSDNSVVVSEGTLKGEAIAASQKTVLLKTSYMSAVTSKFHFLDET